MVRCFRCLFLEQFNYGTWFEPRGISYLFSVVIQKRLVFRKTVVRIAVIMASLDVKKNKGVTETYSPFTVKQWAAKSCSTVHVVNSSMHTQLRRHNNSAPEVRFRGCICACRSKNTGLQSQYLESYQNLKEGPILNSCMYCTFKITMRLRVKVLFSECFLANNPPTPCRNQPNSHQLSEAIQRNEVENN